MATYKANLMLRPVTGGTRQNPNLAVTPISQSTAIRVPINAFNPVYRILRGAEAGQRLIPGMEFSRIHRVEAGVTQRILTGRGAMPLTETSTTTERKPIRRWPRDWHGENM